MPHLQIDIVSDIACPWCAIGLARLEQAMAQLAAHYTFTLTWHAFELRPEQSGQGEAILPALAKKYGRSEQEMRVAQQQMQHIAQELGINFEKIQQRLTCNTFDAHRLVKWAAQHSKQTQLNKALFTAYFGHAKDVSEAWVLLECVAEVGLDKAAASAVLAATDFATTVREEQAYYRGLGINSVPAFIINGQHLVSGAQEPAAWLQIIDGLQSSE